MFIRGRVQVLLFIVFAASIFSFSNSSSAQEAELRELVETLQSLVENSSLDIRKTSENVFLESNRKQLNETLKRIRKQTVGKNAGDIMISKNGGKFVYETVEGQSTVEFDFTNSHPMKVSALRIESVAADSAPTLTWANLDQVFSDAETDGFSGAILLAKDGKVRYHKAFGYANRENRTPNTNATVFAIGSAPIDFTHASILILRDEGKLKLNDPISKFFDGVPKDKQAITVKHLMTGRSGLPDFHDLPTDKEPDHSWIDRKEAVTRIMAKKLLFEPGTANAHSHSAWGLLAAIVEIASGQTYQEFTKSRLYEPAGMHDTGFFGDEIPETKVAVGYGYRKSSEPNSPPHWGKTSWLVMGSGGQVSTLADMFQWEIAVRSGKILSPKSQREYVVRRNGAVSSDGDMYGFEFLHSHNPDSIFMLISNSVDSEDALNQFRTLGRGLSRMMRQQPATATPSKYTLGIEMGIANDDGKVSVTVLRVIADSPAQRSGIEVGDILQSVNGVPFGDLNEVLFSPLNSGELLNIVVDRSGKEHTISIQPERKKE